MHTNQVQAGAYFELAPLSIAAPLNYLLQHVDMNPHATMVAVLRAGTMERSSQSTREDTLVEYEYMFKPMGTKLDELAPPVSREDELSTNGTRRMWGVFMWRNWDKFSDQ